MTAELLEAIAEETIASHADVVERWLAHEPGAWGVLAGQGVLAAREKLGRRLSDGERRAVWSALWSRLQAIAAQRGAPND